MANTKLILYDHKFCNFSADITAHMANLPILNRLLNYGYVFEMPSVEVEQVVEEYEARKHFLSNTLVKKKRITGYRHYLAFSKELTEEELRFWRIFKLGYMSKACQPPTA